MSWYLAASAQCIQRDYKNQLILQKVAAFDTNSIKDVKNRSQTTAEQINKIPNIANKRWVTVQYDSTVGAANAGKCPNDAAVVLAKVQERHWQ